MQRHLKKIHSEFSLQEKVKVSDAKPDENLHLEKVKVDHNVTSQESTEPAPNESLTNISSVNLGDDDDEENFRYGCEQCWFAAETAEDLSKHVESKHKVVEIAEDAGEQTDNQSSAPMDELAQAEPSTLVETNQANDMDIDRALVEVTSQPALSDLPLIINQSVSNEEIGKFESNHTNFCNESVHSKLLVLDDDAMSDKSFLDGSTNTEIENLDSIEVLPVKDLAAAKQAKAATFNADNEESVTEGQDVFTIHDYDESKDPEPTICQQAMEVTPEGNSSDQSSHQQLLKENPIEIVEIEDNVSISTEPILLQHPTKDTISVTDINHLAIETEKTKNDPEQVPKVEQLSIETDVLVQAEVEVAALPQEAESFSEKSSKSSEEQPEVIQLPIKQTSDENVQLLEVAEQTPDEDVQLLEVAEQTSDEEVQLLEATEQTDKKQLSEKLQPETKEITSPSIVTVATINGEVDPVVTDPKPVEPIVDPVPLSSMNHSEDLCMDTVNKVEFLRPSSSLANLKDPLMETVDEQNSLVPETADPLSTVNQTKNFLDKEIEIFNPALDVTTEAVQEVTDVQMDEVTITPASVSEKNSTDDKEKSTKFMIGCNLCDFLTNEATAMDNHLGWNGHFKLGQENLCVFCTFMASTKEEFLNHVKQLHSDNFTLSEWWCSKCDYKSKTGYEMEEHCNNH